MVQACMYYDGCFHQAGRQRMKIHITNLNTLLVRPQDRTVLSLMFQLY